jgi:hypothetical protein
MRDLIYIFFSCSCVKCGVLFPCVCVQIWGPALKFALSFIIMIDHPLSLPSPLFTFFLAL